MLERGFGSDGVFVEHNYRRIQVALANLGYEAARGTIANILKEHGLEPAPERNRKRTRKYSVPSSWPNVRDLRLGIGLPTLAPSLPS